MWVNSGKFSLKLVMMSLVGSWAQLGSFQRLHLTAVTSVLQVGPSRDGSLLLLVSVEVLTWFFKEMCTYP